MDWFDLIVVGSGPGATFAAYGARGCRILVLDVGHDAPPSPELTGNAYELRRREEDLFPSLIGERFESLRNLWKRPISLKLKSPYMSYIVRDWERVAPVASESFEGAISLAKGGLANGWGAGVFRFTDRDLAGFPLTAAELRPYYDELTAHIGVSGANDDLAAYFERDEGMLPPLRLSSFFAELMGRYERLRPVFQREKTAIGRARLAVLTEPRNGRAAYDYGNLEFFKPHDPAIYTPAYTIDEMIRAGAIEYRSGQLVTHYRETEEGVEVHSRNLATGATEVARGRKLLLGAGALNTARIVLESNGDYQTRLPALDNPMACIPFFRLSRIGQPLAVHDTSLAQLNLVVEDAEWGEPLQASLYGTTGPLRSDIVFSLPLSVRANLVWTKYVAPAMGLLMLFYPGRQSPASYVRLRPTGELEVQFAPEPPHPVERRLIRLLRKMGYVTHAAFIQRPGSGAGLHYAGTLPMRANPDRYETSAEGLLAGTQRVYIVDGAGFSRLPAKNLTFTIMANALRIGRRIGRRIGQRIGQQTP
jgi:choline dehydrogenase-like flavoprotein